MFCIIKYIRYIFGWTADIERESRRNQEWPARRAPPREIESRTVKKHHRQRKIKD